MSVNINKLGLRLQMMRGVKIDVYSSVPKDSLLWDLFECLEQKYDCDNCDWEGLSFKEIKELHNELYALISDLKENQHVSDEDKFLLQMDHDENDFKLNVVKKQPESLGEWKSRLSKLETANHFDPEAVKMIKDLKHSLFDRNNLPQCANEVNPNNINNS